MKTNLLILLAAFTMLFPSCTEKQATEFTYDDYLSLQSDDDWVEIMDIDTVQDDILKVKCIDRNSVEGGVIIRSKEDLADVYDSQLFKDIDSTLNCSDSLDNINLDFDNRDYILTMINSTPAEFKRSLMLNEDTKEVLYIVEVQMINRTEKLVYWSEWISIPKLNEGYEFNSKRIIKEPNE